MSVEDFFRCQLHSRNKSAGGNAGAGQVEEVDKGATIGLLTLLFDMADTDTRNGGLDFNDYYALNVLMTRPHAEYEIAFRILDTRGEGIITRKQLGILMTTIAGYRGQKLKQSTANEEVLAKLFAAEEDTPIRYEEFQKMVSSGQLPAMVGELCESIRIETQAETRRRGLGVAAAALADSALASVIAEQPGDAPPVWVSMFAGGVAGALSRTLTAPLERLALLMQVQKMQRTMSSGASFKYRYSGVLGGLRVMVKEGGFGSLFWGNMTNLARLIPTRGISFSLFEQFKAWKSTVDSETGQVSLPSLPWMAVGGSASSAAAAMLCYPLDVIRTRVTVQKGGTVPYKSALGICKTIGVREMYQGFTPSMIKTVPEWGLNFALFDYLRAHVAEPLDELGDVVGTRETSARALQLLACGAVASVVSQTLIYPLDVIRRKMQVENWSGAVKPDGIVGTYRRILRTKGWRGLYSGLAPTYLRVVPATASGFALYGVVMESLK